MQKKTGCRIIVINKAGIELVRNSEVAHKQRVHEKVTSSFSKAKEHFNSAINKSYPTIFLYS